MNKKGFDQKSHYRRRLLSTIALTVLGAAGMLLAAQPAKALNLYDGSQYGNNLEINLTATLSYTGAWRVNKPSAFLKASQDGDSNFQHGMVANLFSIVPVLDIRDGDYGAHFSAQAYVNTPYLGTNQNDQTPYSGAIYTGKQTDFASGTRNADGQNFQWLDAFVFAQHSFANDQTLQFKLGRSVLFWGQSLFFATDGISGGQAPLNIVSAQNLVNPQAQQIFMPVGQAIVTYQPRPGTTIQGYYQFEWEHDYFQGEGAYFNTTTAIDKGGSFLSIANLGTAYLGLTRTHDLTPPSENGQFGLSLQQQVGAWDLGVYGMRFDAKGPELGLNVSHPTTPTGIPGSAAPVLSGGTYTVVYPRDIWLQGASFSTNLGAANVAGEVSAREHQPLGSSYLIAAGQNANGNPGYATGTTWDAQLSGIYVTPGIPLDPGGVTVEGEIILNHLISVTKNRSQVGSGGQGTAGALDVEVEPTYNDVLPNLEVQFPLSINYGYLGRSYVDGSLYHGNATYDIGATATYKVNWIASLTYQGYCGKPASNGLADRGFVSLNLQHTF